jgi:nitroreductase
VIDQSLYNNLLELVKKRRSIRYYKPDPIPDEYIDKILEVARWAPSGFHTQPWEFLVVRKKAIKDKIIEAMKKGRPPGPKNTKDTASIVAGRGEYADAPVFIILLGDWRARVGLPEGAQKSDRTVDDLFCSSLASAFLYMHLAAASLGLASQWCTGVSMEKVSQEIKNIIGIPDSLRIYDMMVVGYESQPPISKELRDSQNMVHYDDCGIADFRTDAEVMADIQKSKAWCIRAH